MNMKFFVIFVKILKIVVLKIIKTIKNGEIMSFGFVKIGAYTPEIRVADVNFNKSKIIEGIKLADERGIELLAFPELCITGSTCGDLFYSDLLLSNSLTALQEIAYSTIGKKTLVFVGLPIKKDGLIYNVGAVLSDGKILAFIPKTYIPNYNESYEKRYFKSCPEKNGIVLLNIQGRELQVPFGKKIILCEQDNPSFRVGVEIGDDLFSVYPPSISHSLNGATLIVNLSCSDETVGKAEYRRAVVSVHSSKLVSAYVLANGGDGESTTDLVFSGHNLIAENGKMLKESKLFSTGLTYSDVDLQFIDFERSKIFNQEFEVDEYLRISFSASRNNLELDREFSKSPFVPTDTAELNARAELILNMQAEGLKKRIKHTNSKSVVIGLSGGLDSTLAFIVSVLAMKKLGRNPKEVIAVTMPCFGTTSRTLQNSIQLAKALGATLKKVDITKSVIRHLKDIEHPTDVYDVTFENAQARERTKVIMDIANMNNGLVVGTGDLSELALGWATYNGDHMSMYGVNGSIPKTLVRHIVSCFANKNKGKLKSVLLDVLDTPVSPELLPAVDDKQTQKTEEIVGPYILHDFYLYCFLRLGYSPSKIYYVAKNTFKGDFSEGEIKKWLKTFIRRFFAQQFKRSCLPDGVKVGSVALSPRGDWRMPSDAVSEIWQKEAEAL